MNILRLLPTTNNKLDRKEAQQTLKRSFSLTRETMEAIREIADDNGVSDNHVLSILVERGLLMEAAILSGGKVVAVGPNGDQFLLADHQSEVVPRRINRFLSLEEKQNEPKLQFTG